MHAVHQSASSTLELRSTLTALDLKLITVHDIFLFYFNSGTVLILGVLALVMKGVVDEGSFVVVVVVVESESLHESCFASKLPMPERGFKKHTVLW